MTPMEREIALRWVSHLRECVRVGVSAESLKAKQLITLLYLRNFEAVQQ